MCSKAFAIFLFGALATCSAVPDLDDTDDVFSLLQAEMVSKSVKRDPISKPLQARPGTTVAMHEELKAELSTGCVAESSLAGDWVPPTADLAATAVVAEEEVYTPTAESKSEDEEAQEFLQQILSIGLRLSLQAGVIALLVDGIRRHQRRGKVDAPACEEENSEEDELLRAALAGEMERCKALLRTGAANVFAEDMWGCTALHAAAVRKGADSAVVACQLLQSGAKVHARDAMDETPLHFAARAGNIEVSELLLAYGAQLDCSNAQELTPLLVAARAGQEEVCKFLLGRGARVQSSEVPESMPMAIRDLLESAMQAECAVADQDLDNHDESFAEDAQE